MKVAVLGTGMVGQAHAGKLAELGHQVTIGTRDVKASLAKKEPGRMTEAFGVWIKKYPKIKVATFSDSVKNAELVINALAGNATLKTLSSLKSDLKGKALIDISNPLDFSSGEPGLIVAVTDSLGEQLQKTLPDVKVIKAFNTTTAAIQVNPLQLTNDDHHLFICGDDKAVKEQVVKFAKEQYGWKNVMDLGDIKSSRGMEAAILFWLNIMGSVGGAKFNYKIVK